MSYVYDEFKHLLTITSPQPKAPLPNGKIQKINYETKYKLWNEQRCHKVYQKMMY